MEELTILPVQVAVILGIKVSTLKRLVSESPQRLPPFVEIGDGPRKRKIWLLASVKSWLLDQERLTQGKRLPLSELGSRAAAESKNLRRKPGRPRKIPGWRELHRPTLE
jgi:hypothetical protein